MDTQVSLETVIGIAPAVPGHASKFGLQTTPGPVAHGSSPALGQGAAEHSIFKSPVRSGVVAQFGRRTRIKKAAEICGLKTSAAWPSSVPQPSSFHLAAVFDEVVTVMFEFQSSVLSHIEMV